MEPGIEEHTHMALLSNILAAYSFVSGKCLIPARPERRAGTGSRADFWSCTRRKMLCDCTEGSALVSFEIKDLPDGSQA
jgi:hypothetical protein